MQIGLIGLGEIGFTLAVHLKNQGHEVIAYDIHEASLSAILQQGIQAVKSLRELVENVSSKRVIWLTIQEEKTVDEILDKLQHLMSVGDIIVDSGNSNYKNSVTRAQKLEALQIDFLDCGLCTGADDEFNEVCATVGGNRFAFNYCEPLFSGITKKGGYLYCGKSGSGQFVKMVHDDIANGMFQSVDEGFEVMRKSEYKLNLESIRKLWSHCADLRTKI
jgi:6-phosphogluconate dehydrogenase